MIRHENGSLCKVVFGDVTLSLTTVFVLSSRQSAMNLFFYLFLFWDKT